MRETQVGWGSIFRSARWMNLSTFIAGFSFFSRPIALIATWLKHSHTLLYELDIIFHAFLPYHMYTGKRWLNIIGPVAQTFRKHLSRRISIYPITHIFLEWTIQTARTTWGYFSMISSMNTSYSFPKVSFYSSFWHHMPGGCCHLCLLRGGIRSILGCELPSNSASGDGYSEGETPQHNLQILAPKESIRSVNSPLFHCFRRTLWEQSHHTRNICHLNFLEANPFFHLKKKASKFS